MTHTPKVDATVGSGGVELTAPLTAHDHFLRDLIGDLARGWGNDDHDVEHLRRLRRAIAAEQTRQISESEAIARCPGLHASCWRAVEKLEKEIASLKDALEEERMARRGIVKDVL